MVLPDYSSRDLADPAPALSHTFLPLTSHASSGTGESYDASSAGTRHLPPEACKAFGLVTQRLFRVRFKRSLGKGADIAAAPG